MKIKHIQVLCFSPSPLEIPMTSLPSKEAVAEALKLQSSLQMFITTVFEPNACSYHVLLAQSALQQVCARD
jgi:hypothetical protein